MSDRFSRLEARVGRIEDAIADVVRKLDGLEAAGILRAADVVPTPNAVLRPAASAVAPRLDAVRLLSLAGRTCVVFGGAYLVRAVTESGHLPAASGVLLGLLYAIGWLVAAERASSQSALFHGLATILIGLPLVLEATTRFAFLSPRQSALALALVAALALGVAWHRRLQALAAVAVFGAVAVSIGLMIALDRALPFALVLLGLSAMTLGAAYHRGWMWLAVSTSFVTDVVMLVLLIRALTEPPMDDPAAVVALLSAFLVIDFGFFAARASARSLGVFEWMQGALALAVGVAGGTAVAPHSGMPPSLLAAAIVSSVLAAYGTAIACARKSRATSANIHFFAGAGSVIALLGGHLVLDATPMAIAWAAGAMLACGLGRWRTWPALVVHGTIALVAAAGISGALTSAVHIWISTTPAAPPAGVSPWIVAIAIVVNVLIAGRRDRHDVVTVTLARLALVMLLVTLFATAVLMSLGPALAHASAGVVALVKSLVLATAALIAAWTARHPRSPDLSPSVYPLLVAGALKIGLEDLPRSTPALLFVALTAFGVALILAPILMRGRQVRSAADDGSSLTT